MKPRRRRHQVADALLGMLSMKATESTRSNFEITASVGRRPKLADLMTLTFSAIFRASLLTPPLAARLSNPLTEVICQDAFRAPHQPGLLLLTWGARLSRGLASPWCNISNLSETLSAAVARGDVRPTHRDGAGPNVHGSANFALTHESTMKRGALTASGSTFRFYTVERVHVHVRSGCRATGGRRKSDDLVEMERNIRRLQEQAKDLNHARHALEGDVQALRKKATRLEDEIAHLKSPPRSSAPLKTCSALARPSSKRNRLPSGGQRTARCGQT